MTDQEKDQNEVDDLNLESDCDIIIRGDFNVIVDPDLDRLGGKPSLKESLKRLEEIRVSLTL